MLYRAIRTRYHGPSNTRGSRYSATDDMGNRITLHCQPELNNDENHKAAAYALRDKMKWTGEMVAGEFNHDYFWIFVK